uniref:UTP--glucose-1-phosphate uridylyltransferase n=1 Tax=Polytomella parva TaxID=51329 RepID=A0A7S0UYF8_9CHLO|mmetsp:Transcript_22336/g.39677  ORF Transcript_22336/g.39677 Transcript_22336/m.39677 type:complete len:515 (+) Transcript_22336:73-1617(+)
MPEVGKFPLFEAKMIDSKLSKAAIAAFKNNYSKLVAGVTGLVPESEILPVEDLPNFDSITSDGDDISESLLEQTAVLKLNGGLGTSMGLEKAKSLLVVKDGKTFVDLIIHQIEHLRETHHQQVKFILMNSFSTSDDTRAFLAAKHPSFLEEPFIELMQNMSPKVDAATLEPATCSSHPDLEWCPPGHGDIFASLLGSGMLDKLLEEGVKYLFVSNSDNLGATLDLNLLNYFAASKKDFMMEVCQRTEADKKGGHLALRKSDGKFMLRESAMCPDEDKAAFEAVDKHRFFNTNNLWVRLDALKEALAATPDGALDLPLIRNKKTVNPRDASSAPVFQLETAMGSAIECFANAGAIMVPRSRFAPVKACGDLFLLRSDAYKIAEDSTIVACMSSPPFVKLDDKHYKLVDQLEALVTVPPSLTSATRVEIKGAVKFDQPDVKVVGAVTFCTAVAGSSVPSGVYDNATVSLPLPEEKKEEQEEKKEEEEEVPKKRTIEEAANGGEEEHKPAKKAKTDA